MPAVTRLDLGAAAVCSGRSVITLRRYIKAGRLPAVKDGRKIYVTRPDLDAAVTPIPIVASDSDLKSWARRMAAAAPPFRPEQRDIIVSTFTTALGRA
ncbi:MULTISPECIES: helix-turn-helix domain-containing protein [Micrococcaceae]|uniref:helix-turn-helix domain-containing protein n=1 Tax=Micrococcaceae TaxID=1268 RepID=UPI00208F121F|nr:helix-turn-helix domain-containing protein [Pseudarthrobacter sp. HLT1-5]MCO4253881.1 helix-turn-helix domain-containing protein [Pseudarthrobacter sp. HLT1-5]